MRRYLPCVTDLVDEVIDWAVVARLAAGEKVGRRASWAEKVAAVRAMPADVTASEISKAFGVNGGTARRLLAEVRGMAVTS